MEFEIVEWKNESSLNPIIVHLNPATVSTKCDASSSLSEFQEWILDNQSVSLEQIRASLMQKTFRDENGILRYTSNWLPATDVLDSTSGGPQKHFFETGCWELQFVLPNLTGTDLQKSNECESRKVITIKVLRDWERLWLYLTSDKSDEFTEHAGLLRACIGFFMHKKTVALFWFLFIYSEILNIWLLSTTALPSFLLAILSIFSATILFFLGVLYNSLRKLYLSDNDEKTSEGDDLRPKLQSKSLDIRRGSGKFTPNLHWQGALRRYGVVMFTELRYFVCCTPRAGGASQAPRQRGNGRHARRVVSSFEDLLNIALKYVLRHCELSPNEIDLNRGGYKFAFLSLITILPLYCLIAVAMEWKLYFDVCAASGQGSDVCHNYTIYFALSFGFSIHAVYQYLLYGALIVSLIGLRYGTELAYYMVDCWMRRYARLRKTGLPSTRNESNGMYSIVSPFLDTLNNEEKESEIEKGEGEGGNDISKSLRTDAIEQYLFMVEYMQQSGAIWSPVITGMYVYAMIQLGQITFNLYSYSVSATPFGPSSLTTIFPYLFQIYFFLIYSTFSIARVNSLMSPMLDLFTKSSKEDFEIIGHWC